MAALPWAMPTWQRVLTIISNYDQPFVIVSATARTTRKLLAAAEQALENLDNAREISTEIKNRHLTLSTNFSNKYPNTELGIAKECKYWI